MENFRIDELIGCLNRSIKRYSEDIYGEKKLTKVTFSNNLSCETIGSILLVDKNQFEKKYTEINRDQMDFLNSVTIHFMTISCITAIEIKFIVERMFSITGNPFTSGNIRPKDCIFNDLLNDPVKFTMMFMVFFAMPINLSDAGAK